MSHRNWPAMLATAAGLALATLAVACDLDNRVVIEPWIGDGEIAVLVDTSHSWEGRPDFVLDDYEFRYCHSQSSARMLNNLLRHNFRYRQFREGRYTDAILKQHEILFFNVPTHVPGGRSKPDRKLAMLEQSEIDAIVRFVADGGGLFVVAEHNNVYDNAEVLNPLLKHFGVQIPDAYAREKRNTEYCIGQHDILIRIHNYKDHPITRRVRETSWLGGAPLETEHGVAFLSDNGHADQGNYITGKPFKHSNRKVDPGEPHGPGIPVVAAVEHGKGRVVVIGDHNVLGIQWLGIADNYRFAMNVFAWLSKKENAEPHMADSPPAGVKLGFDLPHTNWNPGIRDRRGFHPAFINFSRDPRLFTSGLLALDDPADVLILADPPERYSPEDLEIISNRLAAGERVVLLVDPSEPQPGSLQLLEHLLPSLVIRAGNRALGLVDLVPDRRAPIQRIEGNALPIVSPALALPDGLRAAAIQPGYRGRGKTRTPVGIETGRPYLLDIEIEQGAGFVDATASDGRNITIARRFAVGKGEVVLFAQAKIWSNDTFGVMRDEPVHDAAYGAYELQLAFARWLAETHPVVDEDQGRLTDLGDQVDGGVPR